MEENRKSAIWDSPDVEEIQAKIQMEIKENSDAGAKAGKYGREKQHVPNHCDAEER